MASSWAPLCCGPQRGFSFSASVTAQFAFGSSSSIEFRRISCSVLTGARILVAMLAAASCCCSRLREHEMGSAIRLFAPLLADHERHSRPISSIVHKTRLAKNRQTLALVATQHVLMIPNRRRTDGLGAQSRLLILIFMFDKSSLAVSVVVC